MDNKEEKFDSLFRHAYPKLFCYACGIVGDRNDAMDIVGDVFCDLWDRIDHTDMGDNIQSFLYRAVFTHAVNLLKHRGVRDSRLTDIADVNDIRCRYIESNMPSPHKILENSELQHQLDIAIGELPTKCRQVFTMSYVRGMKNADIATNMQTSLRTVEAHMYNALKHLRKRLAHV